MSVRPRRLLATSFVALACAALGSAQTPAPAAPATPPAPAKPAAPAPATPPAERPKKVISDAASSALYKLQPIVDAKKYDAALALLQPYLEKARPESYDAYLLLQLKAQILFTLDKPLEALEPLEKAHLMAETNPNFRDAATHLDRLYALAQIYYQRAAESTAPEKETPAQRNRRLGAQRSDYNKAHGYIRRWFSRTRKPTADARLFAASLLYNFATLDPAKVDKNRLREAVTHAKEALIVSANKSGSQARLLLVACLIQLGENLEAAEHLEVLAAAEPNNESTWAQLQGIYLGAAAESTDPKVARAWNLRALHTIERAQALGFLTSPQNNYLRVAIPYNLGRHALAAELLEKGLADGSIENTKRNWELLASAYQQSGGDERAIDAMARAIEKFPADGGLEFSLARYLYGAGKVEDAYARGKSALAKQGVEKPGQARLYLAYLAYELQRYDEAAQWVAAARDDADVQKSSLESIERAITEAVAQREALKKS